MRGSCDTCSTRFGTIFTIFAGAFVALMLGCCTSASILAPNPTPEYPIWGCIRQPISELSRGLLPERVQIIGTYEHDESQWKIIKEGSRRWVPIPKSQVIFVCKGLMQSPMGATAAPGRFR